MASLDLDCQDSNTPAGTQGQVSEVRKTQNTAKLCVSDHLVYLLSPGALLPGAVLGACPGLHRLGARPVSTE